MKVLVHGVPFGTDCSVLTRYTGPHEIRSLGAAETAHPQHRHAHNYTYDPAREDLSDILARMGDWQPDIALFWYPENTPPPIGVEYAPCRTVALVSDWNLYAPMLRGNLARYDVVLSDLPGVKLLADGGVHPRHFTPLYAHVTDLHKPLHRDRDIDILYVGSQQHSIRPARARFLERLAKRNGRYRVLIASGFDREAYNLLLNRARIIFNHSVRGELNLRVFETLAAGAVGLIEEENTEVDRYFPADGPIVRYNADNFETILDELLKDEPRLQTLREKALAFANEFAPEKRLDDIINASANQPKHDRAFVGLDIAVQAIRTILQCSGSWSSAWQQRERAYIEENLRAHPEDPRLWMLYARFLANPYRRPLHPELLWKTVLDGLAQAHHRMPNAADITFNLGWASEILGDTEAAAAYYAQCLTRDQLCLPEALLGHFDDPDHITWLHALALGKQLPVHVHKRATAHLLALGVTLPESINLEELAHDEQLGPRFMRMYAEIQWKSGQKDAAIATLQAALPGLPFDIAAKERLAHWLAETNQTQAADQILEEARRIVAACVVRDFTTDPAAAMAIGVPG